MEHREKIKVIVFSIACFAAVSIFAASHYRRRRKLKPSSNPCYLQSDSKPQETFKRILADNSYTPFKQLNRTKQEKPLINSHPYEEEITNLLMNPQIQCVSFVTGKVDLEMSGSHVWVETESQLQEVVEVLSKERVFAVDTEQHSLRSFLGFTALIQISTEKVDYLVDTIALHDVMSILSPVFADPSICKVFHGADNDVLWLQRDFHIYVVNLFDTAKACEVLSKPQKSLAYLLETYCGVLANKLLQREDWRLRPLSDEMVEYARADAHYLLYIADCLTTELKTQDTGRYLNYLQNDLIDLLVDSEYTKNWIMPRLPVCPPSPTQQTLRTVATHNYVPVLAETDLLSPTTLKLSSAQLTRCYPVISSLWHPFPKYNNVSENSARLDNKFHFVLEASRRSNMVSMQLYTKDIEASPGSSAASSILSRYLNSQGSVPSHSETKEIVGRLCMWRDFMARLHDESLRYVISDQAIAALASKVPKTPKGIYDTISEADLVLDSTVGSSILSPSPVVCSHIEDFFYLLQETTDNLDDVFTAIFQKHLGSLGTCPLSIYNYALLSNCNTKPTKEFSTKQNGGKGSRRIGRKASRELFVQKFSCKSPVYHNCRIYASDGRLLCYCDRRKLDWYVRRDLAKLVDDNPPSIMLLFEPKGRPEDEDNDFYIQSKKNICVGCGEGKHYLRYRIIPSCYRMHFPEHLKSHRSHDIVLVCVDCHEIAHSAAEKYKRQIAAEFGIPLFVKRVSDSRQAEGISDSLENHDEAGVSPLQLRTAAMALLRHGPVMPAKRRNELTQIVMKYFGGREISKADLESALLVGMSPHERRRLEKKKGLSIRHSSDGVISNGVHENNTDSMGTAASVEPLTADIMNDEQTSKAVNDRKQKDRNLPMEAASDVRDTECCALDSNGEASISVVGDLNSDETIISETGNVGIMDSDEVHENKKQTDETHNCSNGTDVPKYNQKLSLLGHGPHGKLVVDHLLTEDGEVSILQFCQRWRQVFVEAVHPRFLPAGWDVNHSGRRDFGVFSVYNPTKAATDEDKS